MKISTALLFVLAGCLLWTGCDDTRVITDIEVDVSVSDGGADAGEPIPESNTELRTRSECEDGQNFLCMCGGAGTGPLVRLFYTGNARFPTFDYASASSERTTASTGISVQQLHQAIHTAYGRSEIYRFGTDTSAEDDELGRYDLIVTDPNAVRENDVITVEYELEDGRTVSERHLVHRPSFIGTARPSDPAACLGDCSAVGTNAVTFTALLAVLLVRRRSACC